MKLINLFFIVVVFSLTTIDSQAQVLKFSVNHSWNTSFSDVSNEMFWRNLHSNSSINSNINTSNKNDIPYTVTTSIKNDWLNHYILNSDYRLRSTFNNPCLYSESGTLCNHLSHFEAFVQNIDREVKQHPIAQKRLNEYENLMNIYPNPLYSQSIVKFQIPKSGFGKLSVFDLNGREVYNIAIGYFDKGDFEERLTRKNLSKGIYLVTLSVDNYTETKKLVVAR